MAKARKPSMPTDRNLPLLAKKILAALHQRNAIVDIFLLPNADIKKLKARFIKKQTEPNVLAFREPIAFPHPELTHSRKKYLGEIYLNHDILRKSPERTTPLLLHGMLHLLGYDHQKKADAVKMEALEEKVLASL
jgi:probable rRNA maturation factor